MLSLFINTLQRDTLYMSQNFLITFERIQFVDFLEPFLSAKPLSVPNNWRCSVPRFVKRWITARQRSLSKKPLQRYLFLFVERITLIKFIIDHHGMHCSHLFRFNYTRSYICEMRRVHWPFLRFVQWDGK